MRFVPYVIMMLSVQLLASCASLPDPGSIPIANTPNTVYFIYRDWHTSVMIEGSRFVALSETARHSKEVNAEVTPARYVRVGWGDGDYFTGKSNDLGTATRALLASGYSALQFIGYESDPFELIPAETRVPLQLSDQALADLVHYIDESVAVSPEGAATSLPAYVENSGVFLQSSKKYGLFNNCNTWSGAALQTAGLPIRSAFHLSAQSIFSQAQLISAYQRQHMQTP